MNLCRSRLFIIVGLTMAICVSVARVNAEAGAPPAPSQRQPLSWTVDPNFTRQRLPPQVRVWHDRLWKAINHPNPGKTFLTGAEMLTSNSGAEMASSNNT